MGTGKKLTRNKETSNSLLVSWLYAASDEEVAAILFGVEYLEMDDSDFTIAFNSAKDHLYQAALKEYTGRGLQASQFSKQRQAK